jgi:hypothetical protein
MSSALQYSKYCPTCRGIIRTLTPSRAFEESISEQSYRCWICDKEGLVIADLQEHLQTHEETQALEASNAVHQEMCGRLIEELRQKRQEILAEGRLRSDAENVAEALRGDNERKDQYIAKVRHMLAALGLPPQTKRHYEHHATEGFEEFKRKKTEVEAERGGTRWELGRQAGGVSTGF